MSVGVAGEVEGIDGGGVSWGDGWPVGAGCLVGAPAEVSAVDVLLEAVQRLDVDEEEFLAGVLDGVEAGAGVG